MNFRQALTELLAGKKIRRKCWEIGHYWVLDNHGQLVNSIGESPKINAHQLRDTMQWEVYIDKVKEECLVKKAIEECQCLSCKNFRRYAKLRKVYLEEKKR